MNSLKRFNQRSDEVEHILSAGRGNVKSLYDPQKPTPYEIQRQYAEDVKQLRQQFEESQRKQEIKDREQEKENERNRKYNALAIKIAIVSAVFGGISAIISVISAVK